jgi:simple sugar transport system permease protein
MAATSEADRPTKPPTEGPAQSRALGPVIIDYIRKFLALREGSIIVVTLVTFLYFALSTHRFVSGDNFKTLLPYFAPIAIVAAGEVFVMILGEIDLSVGAVYLFIPFVWDRFDSLGMGAVPAMILALIVAMGVGAINGFFVAYVGMASFVATLAMLFTLDGLTLIISHSTPVSPVPGTEIGGVTSFGQIFGGGTYSELFWAIGIVIILQILLSLTRWGIYTVAVGGNRLGAAEAGIRVKWVLTGNFVMCALLAGFVGILEAVRSSSITPDPSGSNAVLLQAIAAAVIGGTLLQGGSGTVVGAFIGAIFLGILQDGLIIKGVSANYYTFYLGVAILIAMAFNQYVSRVRTGSGRGG